MAKYLFTECKWFYWLAVTLIIITGFRAQERDIQTSFQSKMLEVFHKLCKFCSIFNKFSLFWGFSLLFTGKDEIMQILRKLKQKKKKKTSKKNSFDTFFWFWLVDKNYPVLLISPDQVTVKRRGEMIIAKLGIGGIWQQIQMFKIRANTELICRLKSACRSKLSWAGLNHHTVFYRLKQYTHSSRWS